MLETWWKILWSLSCRQITSNGGTKTTKNVVTCPFSRWAWTFLVPAKHWLFTYFKRTLHAFFTGIFFAATSGESKNSGLPVLKASESENQSITKKENKRNHQIFWPSTLGLRHFYPKQSRDCCHPRFFFPSRAIQDSAWAFHVVEPLPQLMFLLEKKKVRCKQSGHGCNTQTSKVKPLTYLLIWAINPFTGHCGFQVSVKAILQELRVVRHHVARPLWKSELLELQLAVKSHVWKS